MGSVKRVFYNEYKDITSKNKASLVYPPLEDVLCRSKQHFCDPKLVPIAVWGELINVWRMVKVNAHNYRIKRTNADKKLFQVLMFSIG